MLWEDNYLAHYGIKGQKWGVRRFQNEDGTLTDAGKARLAKKAGEYLPNEMRKLDTTKGQNRRRLAEAYAEDDEKRSYGDREEIDSWRMIKMTYESNQLAKYNLWLAHSERERVIHPNI